MPTYTLIGELTSLAQLVRATTSPRIRYEPLQPQQREQVANLYHASYPAHIGAATIEEALAEMDATYAGEYGDLISAASVVALCDEQAVGSIQVVHRSLWDPELDCPFIIELFVRPEVREQGIGRTLLATAAAACQRLGETQIALRTSDDGGTSPAAYHLYRTAGMQPWPVDGLIRVEFRRDPEATERILRALPSWFGIEAAIQTYRQDAAAKTSFLAIDHEVTVGVALLQPHFPESIELYLIAVHPAYRRRGIGRKLLARIEQDLRNRSVPLLHVKTVGDTYEHAGYAETRAFYRSCGFLPLEEMTGITWDGPTVIMVKPLLQ